MNYEFQRLWKEAVEAYFKLISLLHMLLSIDLFNDAFSAALIM
jgi:hypothetical protein